jgi:hypothetical protein
LDFIIFFTFLVPHAVTESAPTFQSQKDFLSRIAPEPFKALVQSAVSETQLIMMFRTIPMMTPNILSTPSPARSVSSVSTPSSEDSTGFAQFSPSPTLQRRGRFSSTEELESAFETMKLELRTNFNASKAVVVIQKWSEDLKPKFAKQQQELLRLLPNLQSASQVIFMARLMQWFQSMLRDLKSTKRAIVRVEELAKELEYAAERFEEDNSRVGLEEILRSILERMQRTTNESTYNSLQSLLSNNFKTKSHAEILEGISAVLAVGFSSWNDSESPVIINTTTTSNVLEMDENATHQRFPNEISTIRYHDWKNAGSRNLKSERKGMKGYPNARKGWTRITWNCKQEDCSAVFGCDYDPSNEYFINGITRDHEIWSTIEKSKTLTLTGMFSYVREHVCTYVVYMYVLRECMYV